MADLCPPMLNPNGLYGMRPWWRWSAGAPIASNFALARAPARIGSGSQIATRPFAERSIPISTVLGEAHPAELAGDTLTVEFPASASFHRQLAEEPKNATLLADALYEVTGRRLALAFAVGEGGGDVDDEAEGPAGEEQILELLKNDLGAREREDS